MKVDLSNIKEGDVVAYYPWSYMGEQTVYACRVERVQGKTRKIIYVQGLDFRTNGERVGRAMTSSRIGPLDKEAEAAVLKRQQRERLEKALKALKPADLTLSQSTLLLALLEPFLPASAGAAGAEGQSGGEG